MSQLHLHLFMTAGMSLQAWEDGGMLAREVALYLRLQARGVRVSIVTYGGRGELRFAEALPDIGIVCNRWGWPDGLYRAWLNRMYRGRGNWIAKSNQTPGADTALRAARRGGGRFVARCGYLFSEFNERAHGLDSTQARQARALEEQVFTAADRVVITTDAIKTEVLRRYPLLPTRIRVIPNYVDTAAFSPLSAPARNRRVCFIGRLEAQKNPLALVEACAGLDVDLLMVGEGSLRGEIERLAAQLGVRVSLPGNHPNPELPGLLQGSAVFVLPSQYEGHPKTLIEAMACGMPVIGTDVPGIRELIRHGENGWLCPAEPESIRAGLKSLLDDVALRSRLGQAARAYAMQHFSLDRVMEMELELIRELAAGPN
ncbi:MAG: glycosyltransferase family 4 protein [Chloroflexi bacterium]|nr:glycosyltransferase family 4 protein [Chloroflexota bacterium]